MTDSIERNMGLLDVRQEKKAVLVRQFRTFLSDFMREWERHYNVLSSSKKGTDDRVKYRRELAKWDKFLNLVTPKDLEENGVGKVFFVIWNSSLTSTSGSERIPAQVWLAHGKGVSGPKGFMELDIDYVVVGELRPHENRVVFKEEFDEILEGSIYFFSPVILKPLA
jgi:hypothetical protein